MLKTGLSHCTAFRNYVSRYEMCTVSTTCYRMILGCLRPPLHLIIAARAYINPKTYFFSLDTAYVSVPLFLENALDKAYQDCCLSESTPIM